jgi:hypothetical protein
MARTRFGVLVLKIKLNKTYVIHESEMHLKSTISKSCSIVAPASVYLYAFIPAHNSSMMQCNAGDKLSCSSAASCSLANTTDDV